MRSKLKALLEDGKVYANHNEMQLITAYLVDNNIEYFNVPIKDNQFRIELDIKEENEISDIYCEDCGMFFTEKEITECKTIYIEKRGITVCINCSKKEGNKSE